MITLQQLLSSDTDLTAGVRGGKAADGAQDFLALLAGALSDVKGQGKEAGLTLNDLQTAGGKRASVALKADATDIDADTDAGKLAELLAHQDLTVTEESTTQPGLTSGLLPAVKGDVLKSLTQAAKEADSKTELSDEELAGLSALMAMLPHQQTVTAAAPQPVSTGAIGSDVSLTSDRGRQPVLDTDALRSAKAVVQDKNAGMASDTQLTPAVAATTPKQAAESTPSPTGPTATMGPIVSTPSTVQPTFAAAPVVSAQLGSNEWQQTVSQHITLFTRQGQQSAELRLHPEDLGQVQITLKLDDNQAQLQMVSGHSHVRAALEAALPVLRTQLAENGIELTQSNISSENFNGQQQASSQHQQQTARSGNAAGFDEENDELLAVPASLQSAARGNNAVDIFA
ncbi:flagellar hook length control protein FliK [Leclercia adecarboxylata]|uniref:flagellar hook length control protein FliK n=2 Tax=Leclercia adecarboxylata TaxID=83655 RepID=UPI0007448D19|nr:flagellar hook length control protein FliK [Leclercia adecarboxylata]ALZ95967.1 flagellar hook-length control protein [Leclercia adecarboxylata]MCU6674365.1 flagellar hook length control protein FliK [Leclercia adecarboxylata]MCV3301811.1 flagellar hook length control protein FliK [Leclercia adecarboxylata]MDK4746914.1 flagellar hook length control protein FliK [Leclercia adecarboxylata]